MGRLLDRLRELGLEQKTLVIFMSDNGVLHGEHQLLWKGPVFYEELIRSPLILHWPGRIDPGTRVDSLVSSLDLFPTICSTAGIDPPKNLPGRDLWPTLSGNPPRPREALFLQYETEKMIEKDFPMRGVVTPRYKYVAYRDEPIEQLFDMQADPGETKNLARSSGHASVLADHRRMLREWEPRLRPAPSVPHAEAWRKA